MPKAVALCTPVSDYLVRVDKIPQPNGGARMYEDSWQFGGNASTAIVAVAREGVSAGIMGCVGGDANGIAQRVDFMRHGVDVSRLIVREGQNTPYCICLADEETHGRAFIGGGSGPRIEPLREDELDMDYLLEARYMLTDGNTPAIKKAAAAMKNKGGEVMFDASRWSERQEEMLPYTTIYITSEFYWQERYGGADIFECCEDMRKKGPHTVIFTLGSAGCAGIGPDGKRFKLPIFDVVKVADTTGCGDTFHGAYIVGLDRGYDAEGCARWASAASTFKCACIGGRAGQATAETIEKFLKTGEVDLSYQAERIAYYKRLHFTLEDK